MEEEVEQYQNRILGVFQVRGAERIEEEQKGAERIEEEKKGAEQIEEAKDRNNSLHSQAGNILEPRLKCRNKSQAHSANEDD